MSDPHGHRILRTLRGTLALPAMPRIITRALRLALLAPMLVAVCVAQGTRTWTQDKYDDFEKGTARDVAIASDGTLTLAPSFDALYTSPSTYLWGLAADAHGNVYAAAGSPARVYRLTPDGKASIIFAPQELQVQALVVDSCRRYLRRHFARRQGVQTRPRRARAGQDAGRFAYHRRSCRRAGRRETRACRPGAAAVGGGRSRLQRQRLFRSTDQVHLGPRAR